MSKRGTPVMNPVRRAGRGGYTTCTYCGLEYTSLGIGRHWRHCKSNSKRATTPVVYETWFGLDDARRRFGRLCREVAADGGQVHIDGTRELPLIVLSPGDAADVEVSLASAIADWSTITKAIMMLGTRFAVTFDGITVVMWRHPVNRHGAFKYLPEKR